MNTIHHPLAVVIIVAFAVLIIAIIREARLRGQNNRVNTFDDIIELRHTINVNLSILIRELGELSRIANTATPSTAVSDAKQLLQSASLAADTASLRVNTEDHERLCELLSEVFSAMSKSTKARRLLGACKSPTSRTLACE